MIMLTPDSDAEGEAVARIAGAFAVGTAIITALGWIVSLFASKIVAWIVSLFR